MRTRLGMLLTAPGKTSQTPTVPTVSVRTAGSRAPFHGQRDFGGGEKCIMPIGHQNRAGVAAFAFDGRSGDWPARRWR